MADIQQIRPFNLGGAIAQGVGIEASGKSQQALAERGLEQQERRLGFEQERVNIAQQQLEAGIEQKQLEFEAEQARIADEQEFRESQARINNNLSVIGALPKSIPANMKLDILQNVFKDLETDENPLQGVDLTQIDVDAASKDVTEVWKQFQDGKIDKPQLEVAMNMVMAGHRDSALAKAAATQAGAIARGGEATARTQIAAGGGQENIKQLQGLAKNLSDRLNQQLADETFAVTGARRSALQQRLDFLQDEIFFQQFPDQRPAPGAAPVRQPAPAPTQAVPTKPAIGVPSYLADADQRTKNFFEALVNQNEGRIPTEEEFDKALGEGQKALAEESARRTEAALPEVRLADFIKTRSKEEQDFYKAMVRGSGLIPTEEEFDKAFKRLGELGGKEVPIAERTEEINKLLREKREK
jgi:uncharacterized protein YajQ (UPF0234 family)